MELFDFLFMPRFPDKGLADSVIYNKLQKSLSDISAYNLLKQSFWDTWSELWLPDYMVNPLDIWPHTYADCEACQLWEFLVDDILTSSLIIFRHQFIADKINLSTLIGNSNLNGSYSDYVRNVKQKVPSTIKALFNITQEKPNGPYQIQTAYPNLVAAIIAGVGKSPLSKEQKTRNSLSQNLAFAQLCLESIAYTDNISSHPAEERYIFERLFSFETKICLFQMVQNGRQYPQPFIGLIRHMPNVFSRLIFAQALSGFPEPDHSNEEEEFGSSWLKAIGGYFFPVWQALFCMRLVMKYRDTVAPRQKIIQEIEGLPFYQPQKIEFQFLPKYISKKSFYKRGEKDQYASFVDSWDVDWWLTSQNFKRKFTASDGSIKPSALLMSPLMDYEFLYSCLPPKII